MTKEPMTIKKAREIVKRTKGYIANYSPKIEQLPVKSHQELIDYLESRGFIQAWEQQQVEVAKLKNQLRQIVIEDVPHRYQDRLFEVLK